MGKSLALLSGKGGSGKTTIALSLATMMANCGIKVLLVDCDLGTNGVTYFYEDLLAEESHKAMSVFDVVYGKPTTNYRFIKINNYLDFFPSISKITKETTSVNLSEKDNNQWNHFVQLIQTKYEVIIYDCQSGYSSILNLILPQTDVALFVMEADSISSSALRSLFLKIGDMLNDIKCFQVFNKVTEEEKEASNKFSGGTTFTNLEALTFDWKIRRAFAVSQIPDLNNTSIQFGIQIYTICKAAFMDKSIQKKLEEYNTIIQLYKNKEEKGKIEQRSQHIQESKRSSSKRSLMGCLLNLGLIGILLIISVTYIEKQSTNDIAKYLVSFLLFTSSMITVVYIYRPFIKNKILYQKELENCAKEIRKLEENSAKLRNKLRHSTSAIATMIRENE